MTEHLHTLAIPDEYLQSFKLAVTREIEFGAGAIKSDAEEIERYVLVENRPDKDATADIRGASRLLETDLDLLDQIQADDTSYTIPAGTQGTEVALHFCEVRSTAAALTHALQTMAEKVVLPELGSALGVGPMESEYVQPAMAALTWAIDNAENFSRVLVEEIKAQKAAA